MVSVHLFARLMYRLTRFWPFSLVFTDRPFHYRNRYITQGRNVIYKECRKAGFDTELLFAQGDQYFFVYSMSIFTKKRKLLPILEKIKEPLAKVFDTDPNFIYVRPTSAPFIWEFAVPIEDVYKED